MPFHSELGAENAYSPFAGRKLAIKLSSLTGSVIGKFYPPHRGHKHLIDFARSRVDRLVVIVCDDPAQEIPALLRARWLQEIHADCEIVVTPDDLPNAPEPWAARTIEILGRAPDYVFTSEGYGPGYAAAMGSNHVMVDQERVSVPISATQVRADPSAASEFLEPCVRAWFVPRVVLVGAESTGKTTLAQKLAEQFGVPWVPEYGREFCEVNLPGDDFWKTEHFVHIAEEQQRREDLAARQFPPFLVCDTNAWATGTWHERYMGFRSPEVDAIGLLDSARLYLVPDTNVPFVQDGLRDGEKIREWMHIHFVEQLTLTKKRFEIVNGGNEVRFNQARAAVSALFTK